MKIWLEPQDFKYIDKLKTGYILHRDYNVAYLSNGKKVTRISIRSYNRLFLEFEFDESLGVYTKTCWMCEGTGEGDRNNICHICKGKRRIPLT